MRKGERNLILLFLAVSMLAAGVALSFDLPEAQLFPLITGIITTLLIVAYFAIMKLPALHSRLRPYIEDDVFMKISAAADAIEEDEAEEASETSHARFGLSDEERQKREIRVISYVAGFGVLSFLVGLTIAAPVFMLALMLGYSKESLKTSLLVAAVTNVFIYFVFSVVLRVPSHFGLLGGVL